jgi:hypothetical protein
VVEEVLLTWELGVTGGDDDGFGFSFNESGSGCSAPLLPATALRLCRYRG